MTIKEIIHSNIKVNRNMTEIKYAFNTYPYKGEFQLYLYPKFSMHEIGFYLIDMETNRLIRAGL